MKRVIRLVVPALVLALWLSACDRAPTPGDEITAPTFSQVAEAEGRYIVVLDNAADPAAVAASYGVQTRFTYRHALTGFSAELPDAARQALEQSPVVRWIEPVRVHEIAQQQQAPQAKGGKPGKPDKPDKPCRGKKCPPPPPPGPSCNQGTGDPTSNDDLTDLWGIRRVNAPQSSTWINSPVDVDIAILDTGGDLDHPDLCILDAVSFDPFEPTPDDFHGHGTHVSGTAAARDDNGIVVGVAPTARIWIVKVCNQFGSCFNDAIVAGVDYVTAHADQIDVANMSLGGGGSDQAHPLDPIDCSPISGDAEHLAICNSVKAGVTYVVAAGNNGADASGFVPAAYDEVITMAAMNSSDQAAGFSNFGADVDLIAPGVGILSDFPGGGTATMSGTSMASPHGTGGAALYIATHPGALPLDVRAALIAAGQWWAGKGGLHPEPLLDVKSF
ncbi:MAG: S8 family serine peptidase [Gemmatimonadales bacterium]|nr:S8 family serine peptidase [Gemmatimonadales bacterium]NIP07392.1 S8 family serine peptidase [Gemmatimonadales bacterium]NIQ99089.1 S8 family serine peptidase [Gemmatimonadales bacterium]NIS63882.1 S8 family serine peptidase [Gemmatimonadales bacterium]